MLTYKRSRLGPLAVPESEWKTNSAGSRSNAGMALIKNDEGESPAGQAIGQEPCSLGGARQANDSSV
jgi:hypothetical protein